jgi:hypothetical protein
MGLINQEPGEPALPAVAPPARAPAIPTPPAGEREAPHVSTGANPPASLASGCLDLKGGGQ